MNAGINDERIGVSAELIEIVVNGERKTVSYDLTVSSLLKTLGIEPDRVAVEMNKSIVRKRDWDKTAVPNDSHFEIVQFVGGG